MFNTASAFASTPLPVFQWKIGPEQSPEAVKTKLSIGSWNFVVCWLVHPSQARRWFREIGVSIPRQCRGL